MQKFPDNGVFLALYISSALSTYPTFIVYDHLTRLFPLIKSSRLAGIFDTALTRKIGKLKEQVETEGAGNAALDHDEIITRLSTFRENVYRGVLHLGGDLTLWNYVNSARTRGSKDQHQLDTIMSSAIQKAPYCKRLYLAQIEQFPRKFSDMMELISEKQLRLRASEEEVVMLLENEE